MSAPPDLFASRWVELPAHARAVPEGGLAAGFRAAGVASGIKPSGRTDLGVLVCDAPDAVSAARFSRSGALAAPVLLTQERCELGALRAVIANSGNANAATGRQGYEHAAKTQGAAAALLGLDPAQVAIASTGVIGVPLPVERLIAGLRDAGEVLRSDGDADLWAAISTTDAFEKRVTLDVELSGGTIRISAQAKGAGMISPAFATMLCFVQTDAALAQETAELLLGVTVKRSFDRVSVDGQLSTNDTVVLIASGASAVSVAPESDDELRLGEALDQLLRALAIALVRDGEGSAHVGRVIVRGGDPDGVERAARGVANSPLVKAALHGGDPNWGRIAAAVGQALPGTAPLPFDIAIEGIAVCAAGAALPHDAAALDAAVGGPEVEYEVGLPGEGAETEVFFSDLSHDYVSINAEYTS